MTVNIIRFPTSESTLDVVVDYFNELIDADVVESAVIIFENKDGNIGHLISNPDDLAGLLLKERVFARAVEEVIDMCYDIGDLTDVE